jgi:hypothetical protein
MRQHRDAGHEPVSTMGSATTSERCIRHILPWLWPLVSSQSPRIHGIPVLPKVLFWLSALFLAGLAAGELRQRHQLLSGRKSGGTSKVNVRCLLYAAFAQPNCQPRCRLSRLSVFSG